MSEIVQLTEAQRALAEVETPVDAKALYDRLETLSQYAKRYRLDHDKQNEIAEAKLRTARKGGELLAAFVTPGYKSETRLPAEIGRMQSSRWQALAAIPDADFEEHLSAVMASDEELTLAGALRFQRLGVHFSSDTAEWATPQALFDLLDSEFRFELDVCATEGNAKCTRYFTSAHDGLAQRWHGNCFMNPPYGPVIGDWVRKAYESGRDGATVVCLVPARTDTAWWWQYARYGEIRFIRGRLRFGGAATGAPFPSAVVIFGRPATVEWWEAWPTA